MRADHVISAFGSVLGDEMGAAMSPCSLNRWGLPEIDAETQLTSVPGVWAAGDVAGIAGTTVEAANDGKVAARSIHAYLQTGDATDVAGVELPGFHSPIDEVERLRSNPMRLVERLGEAANALL